MASGVKVAEEVVTAYKEIKLSKSVRYMMMHIDDADGLIKVEKSKKRDNSKTQEVEYSEFLAQLPSDFSRYCLVDLTIPQKNGATKDILFLITWCPEGCNTRSKMLYTTSKSALTDKIREGTIAIQGNDLSDLDYDEFLAKGCK